MRVQTSVEQRSPYQLLILEPMNLMKVHLTFDNTVT